MVEIIRVIDFETSGVEPPEAEVVEVGFTDVIIDRVPGEVPSSFRVGRSDSWLCGITGKIPPDVRAVHHIREEELKEQLPFRPLDLENTVASDEIVCYAAHNADYEQKFFQPAGGRWICTYKAALRVWPQAPKHNNAAIVYWLEDQGLIPRVDLQKTTPSHRAGPDAYMTALLMIALLESKTPGRDMMHWAQEPPLLPLCPIGAEWRGKPWTQVDSGFLRWMLRQDTMEENLKWNARRELDRRAPRG